MANKYVNVDKLLLNLPNESYKGVLKRILIQAPTADVAEIRHGHWTITKDGAAHCSSCKHKMNSYVYGYAYCPLCGARMDKSEDGE